MNDVPKAFRGNLGDVDIRLLRVFRTVVECGGFSGAEAALGTGKSTISKHISDLEERLGIRLCRRGRSGFALTLEGEQIYKATLQLFTSLEDFRSAINGIHSRLIGELSIGFADTIVTDPASPLLTTLAAYHRKAPDVHLRLSIGATTDIERGVFDARLHIGIVVARNPLPGLSYRALYEEESLLYCARRHPLFTRDDSTILPDELGQCAFVRHSYSEDEQISALKALFTPAATADHAEAVAMLILTGDFIGFLPKHYADLWTARGELRPLRPDVMKYHTHFMTVTRKDAPQSTLVDRFLRELDDVRRHAHRARNA